MITSEINFYLTPNIQQIFCFFYATTAKNVIHVARETITL